MLTILKPRQKAHKHLNYQTVLVGLGLLLIVTVTFLVYPAVSYFLADYEYRLLMESNASSEAEVEDILFLCTKREIDIKDSLWGGTYELAPGQICKQYLVLGNAPIDIIFSEDLKVEKIFASYE